MANQEVCPDESLLKHIFPENKPSNISIILHNWDKCVVKATIPHAFRNGQHTCVVRLESEDEDQSSTFPLVAAMQEIAAAQIPDLVPETFGVGTATNDEGRRKSYCVMEFVEGVTLQEVWEYMGTENRRDVVDEIVQALSKLHSVRFSDAKVQVVLSKVLEGSEQKRDVIDKMTWGGPATGFLQEGSSLLAYVQNRWATKSPSYTTRPTSDNKGIKITSAFPDLGSVTVSDSDRAQWSADAVLCHNDLTPRNLILRSIIPGPNGSTTHTLAAIIDWELAGFYPPSYELGLQDTYLSGGNRHVSFYLLLKNALKAIVPRSAAQITLLRAVELLFESQQERLSLGTNIPANIRKRFKEVLRLVRDEDPYVGWKCVSGTGEMPEFSTEEGDRLEEEVIAEMMERRKAKAEAR